MTEKKADITAVAEAGDEPQTTNEGTKETLETLLSEGRKALLGDDLAEAVDKLSRAAELSSKLFTDFAPETFAPFYLYGKALLQFASDEKALIETKFKDLVNDPIVGEIREGIKKLTGRSAEGDAVADQSTATEAPAKEEGDQKMDVDKDAEDDDQGEQEAEEEAVTEQEAAEETGAEQIEADQSIVPAEEDKDDEEEAEIAQLTWEVLDYARTVCVKNSNVSPEWLGHQKDALLLLSKCALNEHNLETAIGDLNKALELVKAHFPDDLRELAFIHTELARVHRKGKNHDVSIKHSENAVKALEEFKEKLQASPTAYAPTKLSEIDELLSEIADDKRLTRAQKAEEASKPKEPPTAEGISTEKLVIKRKVQSPEDQAGDSKKSKIDEPANEAATK